MTSLNNIIMANIGKVYKGSRESIRAFRSILNRNIENQAINLIGQIEDSNLKINGDDGYLVFSCSDLGIQSQIDEISDLAEGWAKDISRNGGDKPFLINLLKSEDLLEIPAIMTVAMHPALYGAVASYLGQAPWLVAITVWLSPPNETVMRSQLYHYDHKDTRQAKIFINLNDIDLDAGPLHFVPARDSLAVDRKVGYKQSRYSDEDVYSAVPEQDIKVATGKKGTGFIVDTARCLHYGSRSNSKARLVMMINYARANCVDPGAGYETLDPVRTQLIDSLYGDDPARSFSIGCRLPQR